MMKLELKFHVKEEAVGLLEQRHQVPEDKFQRITKSQWTKRESIDRLAGMGHLPKMMVIVIMHALLMILKHFNVPLVLELNLNCLT